MVDSIRKSINRIGRISRMYTAKALRQTDLTGSEIEALRFIVVHNGIRQSELCDFMSVDKAAIARISAKLEAKGYICRLPDESDGRAKKLFPLAPAEDIKTEAIAAESDFYKWMMADMDEPTCDAFSDTLHLLFDRATLARATGFEELLPKAAPHNAALSIVENCPKKIGG